MSDMNNLESFLLGVEWDSELYVIVSGVHCKPWVRAQCGAWIQEKFIWTSSLLWARNRAVCKIQDLDNGLQSWRLGRNKGGADRPHFQKEAFPMVTARQVRCWGWSLASFTRHMGLQPAKWQVCLSMAAECPWLQCPCSVIFQESGGRVCYWGETRQPRTPQEHPAQTWLSR